MIQLAKVEVIRVSTSSHIRASPAEVRAFIKPPETALLLDPTVVKAFRVPGTPEGVGEMQGFITHRDGVEQVQLIEVVEENPERLAVVRQIAGNYPDARLTYRLIPDAQGTILEYELALTVSGVPPDQRR
jgi:hypothetical protein